MSDEALRGFVQELVEGFEQGGHYDQGLSKLRVLRSYLAQRYCPSSPYELDQGFPDPLCAGIRLPKQLARRLKASPDAQRAASNTVCDDHGTDLRPFMLTPTQRAVKRLLARDTPYRGLLLCHSVGQGKTCSAVLVAEQFASSNRPALVILPRKLHSAFLAQVFDVTRLAHVARDSVNINDAHGCTGTRYIRMALGDSLEPPRPADLSARILELVASRYQLFGYQEFANHVARMNNATVARQFSSRVIVVDEAHNLRNIENVDKDVPQQLERLLRVCTGTRLLLMTATPMFNTPREVALLLNLLLTNDKEDTVDEALLLKDKSLLARLASRYVSMAERDPDDPAFPRTLTPRRLHTKDLPHTQASGDRSKLSPSELQRLQELPLVVSYTRGPQLRLCRWASRTQIEDDDALGSNGGYSLGLGRQLHNVVFPTQSSLSDDMASSADVQALTGRRAFETSFEVLQQTSSSLRVRYREGVPPFLGPALLPQFACKIATVVRSIQAAKGVCFAHSAFNWTGVIPLAIALEHVGFVRYKRPNILEDDTTSDSRGQRPAYIILSGEKGLESDFQSELKDALDSANAGGGVVKAILATNVGAEGLSLRMVREVHVLDPWYHLNRTAQIVGRATRKCSHSFLPPKDRTVAVHLHVAGMEDGFESVDFRAYRIAAAKQGAIEEVLSVFREHAIDRHIKGYQGTLDDEVVDMYVAIVSKVFELHGPALSYLSLVDHVSSFIPNADTSIVTEVLRQLLDGKRALQGASGRLRIVTHLSDKYIAVPPVDEARSGLVTVQELATQSTEEPRGRVVLSQVLEVDARRRKVDHPSDVLPRLTSLRNSLRNMLDQSARSVFAKDDKEWERVLLDAAVDRLQHRDIMSLCVAAVEDAKSVPEAVRTSLFSGRYIWSPSNQHANPYIFDIQNGRYVYAEDPDLPVHHTQLGFPNQGDTSAYIFAERGGRSKLRVMLRSRRFATGIVCNTIRPTRLISDMLRPLLIAAGLPVQQSPHVRSSERCLLLELLLRRAEQVIRPPAAVSYRAMLRKRKLRGSRTGDRHVPAAVTMRPDGSGNDERPGTEGPR
jgi:hypothetical protein